MRVRLNELERQWERAGDAALSAMARVGDSGRYVLGDELAAFEVALARCWALPFAVGVGSGLDAIEIALRCLGIGPGDRVLTTPLSAFATTLAVLRVGAVPVFVDVDAAGLLDLDLCAELLKSDSGLRCLLPVHLYGHPLDLEALAALAKERRIAVVEDCAQAIGAEWRDRRVGTVGPMAALSFYPTKNLGALGDGGAVLAGTAELAQRARALRDYGRVDAHHHAWLGLNSRLDEIHAAVLVHAFLPLLDELTASRRATAGRYLAEIDNPLLRLPRLPAASRSVWHLFPVLVPNGRRDAFVRHLRERGIESGLHYPVMIPEQAALRESRRFEVVGELTHARDFAANEVSLPVHPFLRADEQDHVIACCNSWRDD